MPMPRNRAVEIAFKLGVRDVHLVADAIQAAYAEGVGDAARVVDVYDAASPIGDIHIICDAVRSLLPNAGNEHAHSENVRKWKVCKGEL